MTIKYILFDAANTLIHKPALWNNLLLVLEKNGHVASLGQLKKNHKLISESIRFPDRTTGEFYKQFNAELLYSLGIIPTEQLLDDIFKACTYLPWEKFEDTEFLNTLTVPLGILSNFNSTLKQTAGQKFGSLFHKIIISEEVGFAKPDLRFFELAIKETGQDASGILYIGDSLKLDVQPAMQLGIKTLLIDRDQVYPNFKKRITSLEQLLQHIQ